MRPIEIALIDATREQQINPRLMAAAVAALNVQVTQHLPRCWSTAPAAIVRQLNKPEQIPPGVWPIFLVDSLPNDVGGLHYTSHFQPAAKVVAVPHSDHWTIDASHEALEMLIDPSGNRLQAARAIQVVDGEIRDCEGELEYLLEICDACEGKQFAYRIRDISVSDFVTPDFYADDTVTGLRYSYTGSVDAPRRILPGGYITWVHARTSRIEQMRWIGSDVPDIRQIGTTEHAKGERKNLREFIDSRTRHEIHSKRPAASDNDKYISGHTPFRVSGRKGKPVRYANAHVVTYNKDGNVEREVWEEGATEPKVVTEHVKAGEPIRRPAGMQHTIRNLDEGLLDGGKDMVHPD